MLSRWLPCFFLLGTGNAIAAPMRGEVSSFQSSASFDERTVMGPQVNLVRAPDGSWRGWLKGHVVSLQPVEEGLVGPNTSLHLVRNGNQLRVRGYLDQTPVSIHAPKYGINAWDWISLTGAAADPQAPFAQLILALVAAG